MTLPIFRGQADAEDADKFGEFEGVDDREPEAVDDGELDENDDFGDDTSRILLKLPPAAANFRLKSSENGSTDGSERRGEVIFGFLSAMNCDATGLEFCIPNRPCPKFRPKLSPPNLSLPNLSPPNLPSLNLSPPNLPWLKPSFPKASRSIWMKFGSMSFKKRLGLLNSIFP